jgi:hypothetical protein
VAWRRIKLVLLVVGVLAAGVIGLTSAFGDVTAATRHQLALAASGIAVVINLLLIPPIHPPASRRIQRPPAVAALGRALILLLWAARTAVYAWAVFSITGGLHETGFMARSAILVGIAQVLMLLLKVAGRLAGFIVDWAFLRGLSGLRYLAGVAAAAVLAGYSGLLAEIAETVVTWVPVEVYQSLHGWGVWGWVAILLAGLSFVVFILAAVLVESLLQVGAARILGPDNEVSAWLIEHLPARLVLTETDYLFEFNFFVQFHWYGPRPGPRPIGGRERQRLARLERPLSREEEQAIADDIANRLWSGFPPRWANFALRYRAAGEHEELEAELNVMTPRDERGVSVGRSREWDLSGFTGIESLRRLRAAGYRAGLGTPFEWVLSFNARRDYRAGEDVVSPYDRAWWRAGYDDGDGPRWTQPPTREDYREDLRRFPIVRRMRPSWLRAALRGDTPDRVEGSWHQTGTGLDDA